MIVICSALESIWDLVALEGWQWGRGTVKPWVCVCDCGVCTYYMVSAQELLIICADGKMLQVDFFFMPETALPSELGTLQAGT